MTTVKRSRRRPLPRRQMLRRVRDRYPTIVQRFILGSSAIGVIYGQAEMLGEPWRHLLAVGCVLVLLAVAVFWRI